MKNIETEKIILAIDRAKTEWKKHDRSAINMGFVLLELTDVVNDGDAGYTWDKVVGATSFADFCRKLGMINRVEYKYRNAAHNIIENRPDYVDDYKLVDDVEYLPGYSLLNLVEENKVKLKKVNGAWEKVIQMLYDEKETRYNIEVAISGFLDKAKVRPGAKNSSKIETTNGSQIGSIKDVDWVNESNDSYDDLVADPDAIIEEFYQKLSSILPKYIEVEEFERKFSELADLFGIPISIAA